MVQLCGLYISWDLTIFNFNNLVVTHRIISERKEGSKYFFVTQGVANTGEDPEISEDNIYGKVDKEFNIDGQCLHASTLGIIHPRTNEYIEFNSKLPEYFQNAINYLDKNYV